MIRVSVASSALITAVCGAMLVPTLAAQPYIQGGVGFGEKSTTQYGVGIGADFDASPWGVELNAQTASSAKVGHQSVEQSWVGLSATYRVSDVLMDDMTFKGGLGAASVYQVVTGANYRDKDYLWYLTPNVELNYQMSPQWHVFASYRFFVGKSFDTYSPNAFFMGARFNWPQSAPSLAFIDEHEDMEQFEVGASFNHSGSNAMGLNISQFILQDDVDSGVEWHTLTLSLSDEPQPDDAVFDIVLSEQEGRLEQALPKGEHTLYFTLNGVVRETGETRQVEGVYSVSLYREQGLNFRLSIQSHLLGESLQVNAF